MRSGHPRQRSPNPGPLFARVVQGLLRPGAYPHPVRRVREIQTHVSAILLAGDFAYKLKKPVRFPFLDMSSLSQRKHLCEEEVRLNRRLSPALYLGVVPIVESAAGMRVGGEGTPVEYAVRMHRLPEDRMMDRLLRRGELRTEAVERLAELIADFHARVESGPAVAVFGSPVQYPDHARRALRAALGMAKAASEFRQWMASRFPDRQLPEFGIGVGVNTGEAVIGDIGTPRRKEFTAIGDTVNAASRLEGATKELHCVILAAESTVRAAGQGVRTGRTDEIKVKGKAEPIRVHEIVDLAN